MPEELPLKQSCIILWAQRKNRLFLTAEIEDLQIEQINCQGNEFSLRGANSLNRYDIQLELYADLKWEERKRAESSRHVELIIPKKEEKWWPRLLKTTSKVQWIKWLDQEEADAEAEELKNPFSSYLDGGGLPSKPFQFPGAQMDTNPESSSDEDETDEEMDDNEINTSTRADQPSSSTAV